MLNKLESSIKSNSKVIFVLFLLEFFKRVIIFTNLKPHVDVFQRHHKVHTFQTKSRSSAHIYLKYFGVQRNNFVLILEED